MAHKIYPYLLGGLAIERVNHVWCADVTYIPMAKGFLYLLVIMDWASRAVLEEALSSYDRPEIFNTDQGSQFTSEDFISTLKDHGSRSAWTARAAPWTTSSSSGCGVV